MTRGHHPEPRPRAGLPLAAKLAAAMAVVLALLIYVFGLALGRFLEDTATAELQIAAADTARTAAVADFDAWTPTFGTEDQGLSPEEVQARVSGMSRADFRRYDDDAGRQAQVAWNRARLSRVLGRETRLVAAELFRLEGERRTLLAASYPLEGSAPRAEFEAARDKPPLVLGDGQAQEGWLTIGRGRWHVVRGSHPLRNVDGAVHGELAVHILADAIEQAMSDLRFKILYAALLFASVGALVSWLIGWRLTRPLHRLQEDIRIVASGDVEHHTRAHSNDEIGQLAYTFDALTRSLERARAVERAAAASRRELAVAAEVSENLFPKRLPELPGWSMAGAHDASGSLGGGTYDVFAMPGGRQGFLLAEASGGGVPAALVAAVARTTLRLLAEREPDPGVVLRQANAQLSPEMRRGMYVAALLAVLEPDTGRLVLANAGHAPLLHHHVRGGGLESVLTEGIALGFDRGPVFDQTLKVAEIVLEPGDTAVLYAGAATALADPAGQALGEKRLLGLVKREVGHGAEALLERVTATLRRFHGGELGPEVTWLAFGRLP